MADQQIHHHHSADSSTMEEELMNSIRRGCELAKKLESDLPNLVANHQQQPRMLWLSIDEIVNTFNAAKEKLLASQMMVLEAATSMQQQEYGNTMDQFLMQQLQATAPYNMMMTNNFPQLRSRGSEAEAQALSPSRPPRSGKKVELEKITKMVAAPEFGNTDLPSDIDGFSWRKYGQKEILGAKYPRSYYRCTHQKLYQCLAKKQVQRNDEDPSMFQVTYRGTHTCHMSSTAPSSSIIPQHQRLLLELELDMPHDDKPTQPISHLPSPSSASASASGRWLEPMNLSLQMGGGGGGGDYPVVDMADAMFNSGSSSGNNSMETLFPSNED